MLIMFWYDQIPLPRRLGRIPLHTNCLAKIYHFQPWSGRRGYIWETNSFCPSPQMPHVTSTDGISCKERAQTGCSTQPKTWLSPACHIIASMWKQNQWSAHTEPDRRQSTCIWITRKVPGEQLRNLILDTELKGSNKPIKHKIMVYI